MASINKLMKQAMKAQQQAQEVDAAMADRMVETSSGGGAVKVVATCKGQLKSIKIDPEAADPEDIESLEDMVMLAVNNAMEEGQKIQAEEMAKVTAGLNMPGFG